MVRPPRRKPSDRLPADRDQALFEAGIKLGGLFHQFIGVPVAPKTAPSLARAIEEAVGLQPFVRQVRVRISPGAEGKGGTGRFGYHYLTAKMIDAVIEVRVGASTVRARLAFRKELNYPLMEVLAATGEARSPPRRRSQR